MLRLVPFVLAFATGCSSDAGKRVDAAKKNAAGTVAVDSTAKRLADSSAKSSAVIDSVARATTAKRAAQRAAENTRGSEPTPEVVLRRGDPGPSVIRALYVNRWATQSRKRMAKLIAAADSTEINALVIDMKDEFGLNYKTQN